MIGTAQRMVCGDQIERNEMGGACSIMGRAEGYTEFWWGNVRE